MTTRLQVCKDEREKKRIIKLEKESTNINMIATSIGLIFFLIFSLLVYLSYPSLLFWKSDYEKNLMWCERNKPMMNLSLSDERIAFCYGEGWKDYCEMSYPVYCPEGEAIK